MSSSEKYWEKREAESLKRYLTDEKEYSKRVKEIYEDMLDNVQAEIDSFYSRYASKEGITIAEAKKRVSKLDMDEYERKAKRYVKDREFSKVANEEMRIYNLTMKVNRLEMLKAKIGLALVSGHAELEEYMSEILKGRTEDELERQAGILGETVLSNDKKAEAIVNASFHNATFSDRIWMNQNLLKSELSKLLQSGLIQGKNPRVLARDLRKRFSVSISNAERLMRTELARVQTEAQKQSFERNGFEQYTFLANVGCCPICQRLNGKHFKVKDMMPGKNASPMHPNCRCSTACYEDSEEYEAWLDYLDKGGTTAEWEKSGKAKWKKVENNSDSDIIKLKKTYEGIPSNWKKLGLQKDSLRAVNPHYNFNDKRYSTNCANCVSAFEMRRRGYNVIARPMGKNHYLSYHPEEAWGNPEVEQTTGNGLKEIINSFEKWPDKSRAEIAITWKHENIGHVFVAEKIDEIVHFYDVQSGVEYSESVFERVKNGETKFWRIDNLEPSDRGITACEVGD